MDRTAGSVKELKVQWGKMKAKHVEHSIRVATAKGTTGRRISKQEDKRAKKETMLARWLSWVNFEFEMFNDTFQFPMSLSSAYCH